VVAGRSRIRAASAGRHVQGDGRIPELGLVGQPDRRGCVQPRHAAQADTGEARQRDDDRGQRCLGIAEIRSETHIRANPSSDHRSSLSGG
jgi:hypothetical protein